MKSQTYVDTVGYEFAHGQRPRGEGRWGFHPNNRVDSLSPEVFWFTGLYGVAKREAVKHFTRLGHTLVHVLS